MLTQAELKEQLHYDYLTGIFTRLKTGQIAGSKNKYHNYHLVRVLGKQYRLHRLAWFYVHGVWPKSEIDHIDGNKSNNAIGNLRDVTRSQNMLNIHGLQKNNTTGYLGVHKNKYNKFRACIAVNGKRLNLGCYDSAIEASIAYQNFKSNLSPL